MNECDKQWRSEGSNASISCKTDLIFFGLVRGGDVSEILDDLLRVLCLASA